MVSFNRFFRRQEPDRDVVALNMVRELLDFASTEYYPKFLVWLESEAARPLQVGNHMDMIQSAVRANTLREVRDTLVRRIEHARAAATEMTEEDQ